MRHPAGKLTMADRPVVTSIRAREPGQRDRGAQLRPGEAALSADFPCSLDPSRVSSVFTRSAAKVQTTPESR
jgi:hypothetical protein